VDLWNANKISISISVGLLNGSLLFSIQQEAENRLCIPPKYYILRTSHDCHISIPEDRKLKTDTVIQRTIMFQKSLRGKGMDMM
jgi:hypothetical protein